MAPLAPSVRPASRQTQRALAESTPYRAPATVAKTESETSPSPAAGDSSDPTAFIPLPSIPREFAPSLSPPDARTPLAHSRKSHAQKNPRSEKVRTPEVPERFDTTRSQCAVSRAPFSTEMLSWRGGLTLSLGLMVTGMERSKVRVLAGSGFYIMRRAAATAAAGLARGGGGGGARRAPPDPGNPFQAAKCHDPPETQMPDSFSSPSSFMPQKSSF